MPRKHNTDSAAVKSIKGKRASITPRRLKERHEAGEDVSNQRALVRLGVANTRILTGVEDLSDWDDDELKQGQKKNRNGSFGGKRPTVVPKKLHDELVRRTLSKVEETFREGAQAAAEAMVDLVKGKDTDDRARVAAAKLIFDRVLGKEPNKVDVQVHVGKFEEAFQAMLVPDEDDDIIDAEVVEDENDVD